jgi:hypothetical protein
VLVIAYAEQGKKLWRASPPQNLKKLMLIKIKILKRKIIIQSIIYINHKCLKMSKRGWQ